MKAVLYEHKLNPAMKDLWDKAIAAGNSVFDIWTDMRVCDEFREMAVMAATAPTPESYNYQTSSSVKRGYHTRSIEQAYIETIYGKTSCCSKPENVINALKCPVLAEEYGKAILFWLQKTGISMDDHVNIDVKYRWAVENLLAALPEYSDLASELFSHHPVSHLKKYLNKTIAEGCLVRYDHFKSLIHYSDMPKRFVLLAIKALIIVARSQESGELPSYYSHHIDIPRGLISVFTGHSFEAFYFDRIPKEYAEEAFQLIYEFLRESKTPFYSMDIETIAPMIKDEEERYNFCARTMDGHPWFTEEPCSIELLKWMLAIATTKNDTRVAEFVRTKIAMAEQEDIDTKRIDDEMSKQEIEATARLQSTRTALHKSP